MKFILATLMIMTSVIFGIKLNVDIKNTPPSNDTDSPEKKTHATYVLKYEDGSIYLYEGETIIETISEINISTLPHSDRQSLYDGIELESADEAYRLIEDFDG